MRKLSIFLFLIVAGLQSITAQKTLTPELLLEVGRLSVLGISKDKQHIIYRVSKPNLQQNNSDHAYYKISVKGGNPEQINNPFEYIKNHNLSPDGKLTIHTEKVKIDKVNATDYYPEMTKAGVQIYDGLHYRHWDTWMDGSYNHILYAPANLGRTASKPVDIIPNEPYHAPTIPFGGEEDYTWNNDGTKIIYVCKKKTGTEYVLSTNTDIYEYTLATKETKNLTPNRKGYDTHPTFSKSGNLAWLSMARDGYESDKNDIIVLNPAGIEQNLTANWDGTVNTYKWAEEGDVIYFLAPYRGGEHLFEVTFSFKTKKAPVVRQITKGDFNVQSIIGEADGKIFVTRVDINHAPEIYTVNPKTGEMTQFTHVNDEFYAQLNLPKVEARISKTFDGKDLFSWVIYPPNFDPNKKYPTLLYCQGGPQSAVSQFYSYRWNFQLMASMGYIVIAPNRRGMPGWGVEWNEAISKDWAGGAMQDYLAAIDDISKESYVDKDRRGAIGASYGGYSVFYLAGIHQKRFKSFISHCGVFNLRSMYGTTEEMFFVNWDMGGAYWDKNNAAAQKTMKEFDPSNLVANWDTPILIYQGGKDYRVPIGQGQEAFNAAQLQGIKSRFIYLPEENHWVLQHQNAYVWQKEFFRWLEETL